MIANPGVVQQTSQFLEMTALRQGLFTIKAIGWLVDAMLH
jgi:hypothetical protein